MLKTQALNLIICLPLLLAACAERPKTAKLHDGPIADESQGAGRYKVGKPYQIRGRWYYPKIDYSYSETGIASWYGPGFHGKATANGETFDQHDLTAAHRTLPLPSLVQVTNLENGRSVKVRVNDRGPFAHNRIIDMSKEGARLLGFLRQGTAKVRVDILEDESRTLAAYVHTRDPSNPAPPPAVPVGAVSAQALPPPGSETAGAAAAPQPVASQVAARPLVAPQPDGVVTQQPVRATAIYVQAGAFTDYGNATRLNARISRLGPSRVAPGWVGEIRYYRVRMGPLGSIEEADRMVLLLERRGIEGAKIVVE